MLVIILLAFIASALAAMITSRRIGHQLLSKVDTLMNGDIMGGARSSAMHPLQEGRYVKLSGVRLRATTITFQQNQSAFRRLIGVMLGISTLVSVSATVLQLTLVRSDQGFRIFNVVACGMFFLFPVVPSFGAMLRAPPWKVLCSSLLFSAIFVEPHWFSRFDLVRIGFYIFPFLAQTLVPLLLVAMTLVNGGSRTIAPIIFLPYFALFFLTFAGVLSLPSLFLSMMPDFALRALLLLVVLVLAVAVIYWMWRRRRRWMRITAEAIQQLPEFLVIYVLITLYFYLTHAAAATGRLGILGLALLLPLAWIPLGLHIARVKAPSSARSPTMLVLRVFGDPKRSEGLFDSVMERWRLTGNTELIVGRDLAVRVIDPDDLVAFLDNRLEDRFITSVDQIESRVAAFELFPAVDGRHRINKCFCTEESWRAALDVLVQRCEVVLMDLRGFRCRNSGCRHELAVLSRVSGKLRVVVLTDKETDIDLLQYDTCNSPRDRFLLFDVSKLDAHTRDGILSCLLAPHA